MATGTSPLPATMKAWQYSNDGQGIKNMRLNPAATPPRAPRAGSQELLIEVLSMALNPADYKVPEYPILPRFLIPKPASPGFDFCGRVVSRADNNGDDEDDDEDDDNDTPNKDPTHDRIRTGQLVFGRLDWPYQFGTLGQFILCHRSGLAALPTGVTPDTAAGIPTAALTAYQSLAPHVRDGSRVLINGASGGVGVFAIQIAKLLGCHVTAVCSGANMELCRSLGADACIDYTREGEGDAGLAAGLVARVAGGSDVFDLVVDNVGRPLDLYRAADHFLRPGASYVQVAAADETFWDVLSLLSRCLLPGFLGGGRRAWKLLRVENSVEQLVQIGQWVKEGKIKVLVDSVWAFEDAREAYAKLRTKRARGKIIVRVAER